MRKTVLLLSILFSVSGLAQTGPTVAQRRAAHLRHGINLSEWFAQVYDPKGYTKEHLLTWVTADDIALIKSMGFDHVRLSVNPEPMMRHNMADHLPQEYV
jgi:endoglucanase